MTLAVAADSHGPSPAQRHLTLALCTLLHGFTHALGTVLVPLYLLMRDDLRLSGIGWASLLVTIYGLVYCLCAYPAGVMADRFNRKWLLGLGLIGNALAVGAMGLTRQYEMLVVLVVLAGVFGALFHPTANALVPAHYPNNPGLAIGVLGAGSGIGFFLGPQFGGWRAESAAWQWGLVADWQKPLIEMGAAGVVCGIIFLMLATETRRSGDTRRGRRTASSPQAVLPARLATEEIVMEYEPQPAASSAMPPTMVLRTLAVAAVLGCRDFAGVASLTLASLYLQKAHEFSTSRAGLFLGVMMLFSIVVNPLAVLVTPGRRRLPALAAILILGGLVVATVPWWSVALVLPVLCVFQSLQLGSYAVSDAAMLERVAPEIRGRIVGLFLTVAGTFASMSPLVMGFWVDYLGVRAAAPEAYAPIFGLLGLLMGLSALSMPMIARLSDPLRPAST